MQSLSFGAGKDKITGAQNGWFDPVLGVWSMSQQHGHPLRPHPHLQSENLLPAGSAGDLQTHLNLRSAGRDLSVALSFRSSGIC